MFNPMEDYLAGLRSKQKQKRKINKAMSEIKLNIDGTEYEFDTALGISENKTPILKFGGVQYIGKAIPKEIKPDYEILTWNHYVSGGISTIPSLYDGDKCHINSVRRLSDNEVFSIGDKVTYRGINADSWENNDGCLIEQLTLKEGNIYINQHFQMALTKTINDWVKVKPKILFTTEDGVKVPYNYQGEMWRVFTKLHSYEMWTPYNLGLPRIPYPEYEKYFSTKEAVEEYILLNKPIEITQKELKDVIKKRYGFSTLTLDAIYELFKSKIKL